MVLRGEVSVVKTENIAKPLIARVEATGLANLAMAKT